MYNKEFKIVKTFRGGWAITYDNDTHILTITTVINWIAISSWDRYERNDIGLKLRLTYSAYEGVHDTPWARVQNAVLFPTEDLAKSAIDWMIGQAVMNKLIKTIP